MCWPIWFYGSDAFAQTAGPAMLLRRACLSLPMTARDAGPKPWAPKPQMYESDDIIAYLFKQYGDGEVPLALRLGGLTTATCSLGLAARYALCVCVCVTCSLGLAARYALRASLA